MLGEMLVSQKDTQPFQGITPLNALKILRVMLGLVGVANPECYRTHDLRRGHARDMQAAGKPLYEILTAGNWRSSAFADYMDLQKLEDEAVFEAHLDESDSEIDA